MSLLNQPPSVTCAFTLYNCQGTIVESIRSAIDQDYPNKYFLLVDDCSTDDSVEKALGILASSNISFKMLYSERNVGVGASRDLLLRECTTEFIAFFDDDDISHPNRLTKQIQLILNYEGESNGRSAVCYSDRVIVFNNRNITTCSATNIDVRRTSSTKAVEALLSISPLPSTAASGSSATCVLCARTNILEQCGGFNRRLRRYEDVDLAIRCLLNNYSLISCRLPLVTQYYTETEDKKLHYRYHLRLLMIHKCLYPSRSLYEFSIKYVIFKNAILHRSSYCAALLIFFWFMLQHPLRFLYISVGSLRTLRHSIHVKFNSNPL
jgi:glycosyltransferase involved in cell wall biosynthesis